MRSLFFPLQPTNTTGLPSSFHANMLSPSREYKCLRMFEASLENIKPVKHLLANEVMTTLSQGAESNPEPLNLLSTRRVHERLRRWLAPWEPLGGCGASGQMCRNEAKFRNLGMHGVWVELTVGLSLSLYIYIYISIYRYSVVWGWLCGTSQGEGVSWKATHR